MKRLWLLLVICCTPTLAAEITLVIPKLSKGQVASAEGDRLHARYDEAWAKYDQAIAKVVADVTQALDAEFNKAADRGSLESADMWDKKKKAFLESNAVTCEIPDKPKASARKKPAPDAPKTFPEILQAAQQEMDNAVSALKSDYETLIREYTKARNLERAKQLKEEVSGFANKPPAGRPRMVESRPDPTPVVAALRELPRGFNSYPWVSPDGSRLYWTFDDGEGKAIWSASRRSPSDPFANSRELFKGTDPSLTEDETEIFVMDQKTIKTAKRKSRDDEFGPLQPVAEFASLGFIARPCVSPDGLMLWFDQLGDGSGIAGKKQTTVRVIRRLRGGPWGQLEQVRKDAIGSTNGFFIRPKEQYGIFPLKNAFVLASTKDAGQSFGNPERLQLPPNTPDGKQPFYSPVTRELFFAGHPDPAGGKESLIYVIRDLDLPTAKK